MKNLFNSILASAPKGQKENSPAFQRRDGVGAEASPEGTNECVQHGRSRPSLRDLVRICAIPSVKTLGYCRLFLRNKRLTFATVSLLISGFGFSVVAQTGGFGGGGGGGPESRPDPRGLTLLDTKTEVAARPEE